MIMRSILLLGAGFASATGASPGPAPPPVLTVCEALRNLDAYRGRDVVIVAQLDWTFEGDMLHESCETGDSVPLQGSKWPSIIALAHSEKSAAHMPFPVDQPAIRQGLRRVNGYREAPTQQPQPAAPTPGTKLVLNLRPRWAAVYGQLESPAKLSPPRRTSNPGVVPGNGYGANGSVPARLQEVSIQELGELPLRETGGKPGRDGP
jgi:hypothetical protein